MISGFIDIFHCCIIICLRYEGEDLDKNLNGAEESNSTDDDLSDSSLQ